MAAPKSKVDYATGFDKYLTSRRNVLQYASSPTSNLDIIKICYSISFKYEDISPGTRVIAAIYDMYLCLSDNTDLKLSMRREGGKPGQVTGVLEISQGAFACGTDEWKSANNVQFLYDVPLEGNAGKAFKVMDLVQLFMAEGLYEFSFKPTTHPFHWIWHVVYRLVVDKQVAGGTARRFADDIDEANTKIREKYNNDHSWEHPVPQLDHDFIQKDGIFGER